MNLNIIDLYNRKLNNPNIRFKKGIWDPADGGYENFKRLLRYIVLEKRQWSRDELLINVSDEFLRESKLYAGMERMFQYRIEDTIISSWEE
ncbi:MAG TPA: hypothetical protein DEP07_19865 [Brevibacillus sp.]|uniref:DUF4046 domain-containing protein n=1 Tax=Brevibacillus TaxID=55080 RepID=UPI000EE4226D|nr:hypothetical protein [Brevibacillus sp.]